MLPSIVGIVIQYRTRSSGALRECRVRVYFVLTPVFGYYIMGSYVATLGLLFAGPGANIAGYTKRVTTSGMIFVAYATGNIIGPHLFHSEESPPYRSGMLASMVCFCLVVPMVLSLRAYYVWENRRRDRRAMEGFVMDGARVEARQNGKGREDSGERGGRAGEDGEPDDGEEAFGEGEGRGDFADWTDRENPAFRYAL